VEPMGFEPTTSSMPSRRAPNCATAPPGRFSDVSIRALASSIGGRESVVVSALNVASEGSSILQIRQKGVNDGKFKPDVLDSLPRVFILVNMVKTL
jgi:hypothetical protein